ncbi:hypothetical protein PORY_001552 [Pneumocystis oryctolagi]|uniref:Uncharacterized protein n=1 Tax=Pneumocystis oryctolagi TaxID=42067 RepID=A0ACB7CAW8_9ASCO|nr:hypothetical protein PORY_001552 [Pneumocystis oryctolagi]
MVLKKRNPREVISMFLRSTEDFSSFFEAGIFVKEKKCLIKHSYVAIIRYKGYDFSSYKESALFLICMKKSMMTNLLFKASVDDLNIPYFSEKIYSYIHNTNNHIKNLNNNVSDWIDHKLSVHKSFFIESRDLKVKVCSWNVNGKEPVEDISDWLLYKSDDNRVDLYVIGLQEIDLSTEAYLHNDGIKEQVWNYSILSVLGDHYEKVVSKQLVGILLLVYAHKAISPSLTSITTSFVGCGIMGIMGNKGAVAIRLIIWDTVFCFVNSHLAAMRSQVDRRNQNFREICRKMYFHEDKSHKDKTPKSLFDCDHLIWCGDLNYRIDMSVFDVKELSKKREYDLLLEFDQLNIQKRLNHCFENFIEAEINFPPTFKYKTGTSEFDSSEKMRVPSWTDRILWKSKGILVKNYRSYMDNVMSDHKPISAELNAKIEILLVNDYLKLRESLMKEYRCSENKMIPMINLSVNHFNFENVVYFQPKTRVLRIDNIGQVVTVEFEFIPKKKDTCICKPWIWPYPCSGLIDPGDCHYINLTVYVDNTTVSTLNSKDDSLDDILILHLKNGGDFFISVEGTFLPTRFGMSLEQLSRLDSSEISNENNSETYLWSIPKEIIRITEYLLSEGKNIDNLFFTPGSTSIMTHIREALDTGNEFDLCILENNGSKDNIGLFSMAQTLLMFLDALPDSIIPSSFYYQCLEASRCKEDSIIILDMIPSLNANLFIYMADFVREVLWDSSLDTFKRTACLFSSILMRSSSFKTEQHLQKQNAFFQWFLSDSHPNLSS